MTSIQFNQTRTCIEDALASTGYGEKMIAMADQYRREGNHAAANAAHLGTWNILESIDRLSRVLPRLTPEHAALLDPSERQQLAAQLQASSENLNRLLNEHSVTESQLDACDTQEADWYVACLRMGHLAHLARNVDTRVNRLPETEDLLELAEFAVSRVCEDARELLATIQQQEPPTDAFPQTRRQTSEQALSDHAELAGMHSRITQKLENVRAEAANSPGWCHLCRNIIRANDAKAHVETCIMDTVQSKYIAQAVEERYARSCPIMIGVRSEQLRHWMMLVVQPTTSLRQLDRFLRNRWLECCGHMSHFEISDVQYSACLPGPGDPPMFDTDLVEPDELHMVYTVEETITAGLQFHHEFDYGDTTCLDIEHMAVLPMPYRYLRQFIKPPADAQGHHDDFITIVAHNQPPERCFTCGDIAYWRYAENPYIQVPPEHGGPIVAPPYFCDNCAPKDVPLVILRNSPRAGVGCYDNTYDKALESTDGLTARRQGSNEPQYSEPAGDPDELNKQL